MRIVLDTNVWIAALVFPGGICDQIVQRFLQAPSVELLISPFILQEIRQVLDRKFGFSLAAIAQVLQFVREHTTLIEPTEQLRLVREKEADNRILECAVSGGADLLVTGDTKHLLPLKAVRGIPIRSPRQILDAWG